MVHERVYPIGSKPTLLKNDKRIFVKNNNKHGRMSQICSQIKDPNERH